MIARHPRLDAILAILQRDAQLFVSYRLRFLAQGLAVLFTAALFYYVSRLVTVSAFPSPDAYFAFVIVGLATIELLTASLAAVPAVLRQELISGTFERLVVAPVGPVGGILGMACFPIALSLVVGTFTILVGVVLFGLDLHWSQAPLAIPVALLSAVAFLPFTLVVASAVLLFKQAGTAATFLSTGLGLASGAFFPTTLLPAWIRWVADVQPLRPALELMRHVLIDAPVEHGPWGAVLRLALFALVGIPLGLVLLSSVIDRCRARGTLTEY